VSKLEFTSETFVHLSLTHYDGQLEAGDHNSFEENPNKLSTVVLKRTTTNARNGDFSTDILSCLAV